MSQEPFDISNNAAESNLAPSHAYVSKKTKKEDVTSTAYTFTIVSVVGFILLILFGLDLLPFQSAAYSKTMILIVMGVMFAIFLFVGIHSFMELKSLSNAADREEQQFEEICQWFLDTYTAEKIKCFFQKFRFFCLRVRTTPSHPRKSGHFRSLPPQFLFPLPAAVLPEP